MRALASPLRTESAETAFRGLSPALAAHGRAGAVSRGLARASEPSHPRAQPRFDRFRVGAEPWIPSANSIIHQRRDHPERLARQVLSCEYRGGSPSRQDAANGRSSSCIRGHRRRHGCDRASYSARGEAPHVFHALPRGMPHNGRPLVQQPSHVRRRLRGWVRCGGGRNRIRRFADSRWRVRNPCGGACWLPHAGQTSRAQWGALGRREGVRQARERHKHPVRFHSRRPGARRGRAS